MCGLHIVYEVASTHCSLWAQICDCCAGLWHRSCSMTSVPRYKHSPFQPPWTGQTLFAKPRLAQERRLHSSSRRWKGCAATSTHGLGNFYCKHPCSCTSPALPFVPFQYGYVLSYTTTLCHHCNTCGTCVVKCVARHM